MSSTVSRPESITDEVVYVKENLVLDSSGEWWAVYRLKSFTYDLAASSHKTEIKNMLHSALSNVGGVRIRLLSVVGTFRNDEYIQRQKERPRRYGLSPPSPMVWASHCDSLADHLAGRAPFKKHFFLCIRLRQDSGTLAEVAARVRRKLILGIRRIGQKPQRFESSEPGWAQAEGSHARERFGSGLVADEASEEEVLWLIARGPYRATGAMPSDVSMPGSGAYTDEDGEDNLVPVRSHMRRLLSESVIVNRLNRLECHHGDGVISHQRFLSLSAMPLEDMYFPGCEWAYLDLPVDVCLDFNVVPAPVADRQRKNQGRKAKEQSRYIQSSDEELPLSMTEAYTANKHAEALHRKGEPRIDCHTTIAVAASTRKALESLTRKVRQYYGRLNITTAAGAGTQLEAFADFMPAGGRHNTDFRQPMAASTLAGSIPVGDSSLGDGVGFYLGRPVASNSVVTYDPQVPMRYKNMSGSCAIVGDLGSGKTFLYQCLMCYFALAGHRCLLIDPKGDSRKLFNVPEVSGAIRQVDIAEGSQARLPIFSVYDNTTEEGKKSTETLLRSFLMSLFEANGYRYLQEAIRLGIRRFMSREAHQLTVSGLVDTFHAGITDPNNSREVQEGFKEATSDLNYYLGEALAGLVLNDECREESEIGRGMAPITVMNTSSLDLPKRDAMDQGQQLDERKRISQAVLSVVAASAYQMASQDRFADNPPFKALGFDEAWRFIANPEGGRLLDTLIREGRSQNVAAFIMSQLWADVEALAPLMSIRFMGRNQQDEDDIRLGLSILGIDASPEKVAGVQSFTPGHFIHQDVYSNTGTIYHEPFPPRWLDQLGSTPGQDAASTDDETEMAPVDASGGPHQEEGTAQSPQQEPGPGRRRVRTPV